VTKPFQFEGKRRERNAEEGLAELKDVVDSLIVIPNQRLLSISGRNMSLTDAFKKADDILYHGVKGISDLVMVPGLINLDFADVKTIMSDMGLALMGTGIASGEGRAVEAAQKAISSPLLEDNSIQGARGVLLNITGNSDLTLFEVNEASTLVQTETHEDANIIFGTVIDENMGEELRVTVIATGFDAREGKRREETIPNVSNINTMKRAKEDLATPTFVRQKESAEKPVVIKMGMISDEENYDFETPAFLRKTEN
jgi:cell division protein FtsZ